MNFTFVVMMAIVMTCCGACGASLGRSCLTFTMGDVHVNGERISAPQEIFPDSQLQCAADALSVLQIGDAIKFVLRSGTTIQYAPSASGGTVHVTLEKGSVAADIASRAARVNFVVNEISFSAGKGSFDVMRDGDALTISVFEGSAEILKYNAKKELNAGEKFEMMGSHSSVRKLTPQEKRFHALMKKVKAADLSHIEAIAPKSILPIPVAMEMLTLTPENISESLSFALLAQKEGPLSIIITKQGKRIVGHLQARGKLADIATREGKITIAQKDIVSVTAYGAAR